MNHIVTAAVRRVAHACGVDRAVGWTVMGRLWMGVANLVTLATVGRFLSQTEQGYYFTFASLLGLQVFVELGLSYVIMQFASHERAKLALAGQGTLEGDPFSKARLASLLQLALRWYGVVAILFVCLSLPIGFVFLGQGSYGSGVNWRMPWLIIVPAWAGTLFCSPILSLLEGCGFVASVAGFRLVQGIAANVTLWVALAASGKLFAAAVFALVNLACVVMWLFLQKRRLLKDLLNTDDSFGRIRWWREVWPFQWRISVSWLSGYFVFQVFTPILFAFRGPVEAGQMGMSLSLMGAVSSLALSWINTKAPGFGMLVSQGDLRGLDALWFRSLVRALGLAILGAVAVILGTGYLHALGHPFADRILPPLPLVLLVSSTLLSVVIASEAIYLRAFKREPFLVVSVLNGIFVVSSSYILGPRYGALGMMTGYLAANLVFGLGLGTAIFVRERRRHREAGACPS